MTVYCYSNKDGEIIEREFDMGKAPKSVKKNGNIYLRDLRAEQGIITGDTWSVTGGFENERHETGSLSRAIHEGQVAEQMALDKQKGVHRGVEWKPDGRGLVRPHFSSKRARDNWDRAHGFISESHY